MNVGHSHPRVVAALAAWAGSGAAGAGKASGYASARKERRPASWRAARAAGH